MQGNPRKITYGAMMIAMFVILLAISFYIPLVGSIVLFFIPLPIILYRLRYDRISALLVMLVGFVLSLFIGGIASLPFAIALGLLGFIIGDTMSTNKSKFYTFMASGLTFLVIMIFTYVSIVLFLGINLIEELMTVIRETQGQMTSLLVSFGNTDGDINKQMEDMFLLYETAIPSSFIIAAFSFSFIVVVLNSIIVNRVGHNVPKFSPFREMKLPSITVWVFLVILALPFIANVDQGTTLNLTYVNASVIFRFLFLIQGISLIHYFMFKMKLPTWALVMSTILAVMLSPATTILGILDSGMRIRDWIGKDTGKRN